MTKQERLKCLETIGIAAYEASVLAENLYHAMAQIPRMERDDVYAASLTLRAARDFATRARNALQSPMLSKLLQEVTP